jgi:hypothetical protein
LKYDSNSKPKYIKKKVLGILRLLNYEAAKKCEIIGIKRLTFQMKDGKRRDFTSHENFRQLKYEN